MFRPGENIIYDLVVMVLRVWWGILKLIVFGLTYFFGNRPQKLEGPRFDATRRPTGAPPDSSTEDDFSEPDTKLSWKMLWLIPCFLGGGLIILGLPSGANRSFQSNESMLLTAVLIVGGGALILWGMLALRRKPALSQEEHENVEALLDATEQAVVEKTISVEKAIAPVEDEDIVLIYTIRVPKQSPWEAEVALHFVSQLLYAFPDLLLGIVANNQGIRWELTDAFGKTHPEVLEQLVRASYPDAEVSVAIAETQDIPTPFYRYTCAYQQLNEFVAPLRYVDDLKASDPLNTFTQALSGLKEGEEVTFLLAIAGNADDAYKRGEQMVTQSTIHPLQIFVRGGFEDAAAKILTKQDRVERYDFRDQRALENKLREKLYYAYALVQIDTPEQHRVLEIMSLLDTQIDHFTRMPYNALIWTERSLQSFTQRVDSVEREAETHLLTFYDRIIDGDFRKGEQVPRFLILEPREIAALWHLPSAVFSSPRIEWSSGLSELPEAVKRQADGLLLGAGKYQGRLAAVNLPHSDRVTHLNLIGRTGTGKSTMLHSLVHQDIANGAGVAVIDPHGQLVRDILRTSIPPEREQDVIVLDIADREHPPPLNPLSHGNTYVSTLKMVGVIERLFAGTEGAARMASYLRAALVPLSTETSATMRDVTRMFMDDVYREQRLIAVDDPETLDFWDYQYNSASAAMQRQIADPIINRIRPFYANPTLYPILCHPDALDLGELMQQKKIILISLALDEEQVPEQERNLIGGLLVSQLQMAGMKAQLQEPFYFYVDEVQRFVTTSLSEMLSEARKYNLSLITANQYLGQLTGKTLEAVMGNVGTSVIFRCSPDDARDLASYTKPEFDAQDLVDLNRFQTIVKMQVQGQTQPSFKLLAMPPLPVPEDALAREQRIRHQSMTTYTPKSRAEVLAWLKDRYPRRRVVSVSDAPSSDETTFYE